MSKDTKELAVSYEVDGQKVTLTPSIVQKYIVGSNSEITLPEFKFFTELCKSRGLNPFLKEAYCIKYGNEPAAMIVGKDAILKRAVLHPKYDGMESGVIVLSENGEIVERSGTFKLSNEEVVGGWARVYRKDWSHPIYCSVSLSEAAQKKRDGNYNTFWHNKPATMIEKVAKVRALRETFVESLGGMYEAEEMGVEIPTDNVADLIPIDEGSGEELEAQEAPPEIRMTDLQ